MTSDSQQPTPLHRTRRRQSRHRKQKVNESFRHSYGRDPRWWRVVGLGLGIIIIAVVLLNSGTTRFLPSSGARAFYEQAFKQFEDGNYRTAVIELKNALSLDPQYTKARRLLAQSYLALGQASSMPRQLQLARENDLPGVYEQAAVRFESGNFSGAIIQLKNVLKENSDDSVARLLLGQAYLEIGDGYSSEVELEKARSASADESLLIVPLARAYLLQKKYEVLFNEIQPDQYEREIKARLLVIQGQARLARNEFGEANLAFIMAMRFLPGSVAPLIGQARIKLAQGSYAMALQTAQRAENLSPNSGEIWDLLGEIRYQMREFKQALVSFNKAIVLAPNNRSARKGQAKVLIDLQRYQEAETALKPVWESSPGDSQASYLYAITLARNNKITAAQTVLRDAALYINSLDPVFVLNDPDTLLISGLIDYVDGDMENAYRNLQRFVIMQPRHFSGRQLLAAVLLQRNDPEGAIKTLLPVMVMVQRNLQALVILGSAYTRAGRHAQASKVFIQAMALGPNRDSLETRLVLSRLAAGRTGEAFALLTQALETHPGAVDSSVLIGMIYLQQRRFKDAYQVASALARRQPENPFAYNIRGAALIGLGDLDTAREEFVQALRRVREFMPARFNLAKLNLLQGNLDSARAGFSQILKSNPQEIGVLLALADLDERLKHYDLAAKWLQRARKSAPGNYVIGMRLTEFYLHVNKFTEALEIALELEANHPGNLQVLALVSRVQYALGQRQAARQILKNMLRLAADQPAELEKVALLQMRVGDLAGAWKTLQSALQAQPRYIPARVLLIDIAVRRKQFNKALALASDLRQEFPENTLGYVLEGQVLADMKRFSDAASAYVRAFRIKSDPALLVRFYRAQRDAGKPLAGLPFLVAWLGQYPGDLGVRRALAAAYVDVGQLQKAIELHETLLAEMPDDAAMVNNLAGLYFKTDDSRALEYARKAYELAPEQPATLDTLGWILVREGQVASGLKYLRQAHIRNARDPAVSYHIAVALQAMGRSSAARRQLQKALKTGAEFEGLQEARKLMRQISDR